MNAHRDYTEFRIGTAEATSVKRNKRGRIWSREENERIVELYQAGVGPSDIAALFGVTRMSIESKLHYWGIRRPMARWSQRERERALTLSKAGVSNSEIARLLERTPKAIEVALYKMARAA